jgi:hypothetical protein
MQSSEEQFQELLANLVARGNKALAQNMPVPPMSFALSGDGVVHFSVGAADSPKELKQVLNAMQESLVARLKAEPLLATCVAYTEAETNEVVALLENLENYCATVRIPRLPGSKLNLADLKVEDGFVYVFPIGSDS